MKVPVEIRLIDIAELCAILKRSRASVYRDIRRDKNFPKSFRLPGGRSVRWRLVEVLAYIDAKTPSVIDLSHADCGGGVK